MCVVIQDGSPKRSVDLRSAVLIHNRKKRRNNKWQFGRFATSAILV